MSISKRERTCTVVTLAALLFLFFRQVYEEEFGNAIPPKHFNDIPNPLVNPSECGRDSNKPSYICDPDMRLSHQFKSELDQMGELIDSKIYLVVVGNFDASVALTVPDGRNPLKISTYEYSDLMFRNWNVSAENASSRVMILLRLNSNDNSALFSLHTNRNQSISTYSIKEDMYYLYHQRLQWFRPKTKQKNREMLKQ